MDLDLRFVKGEITTREYLEQKAKLVKIVEKVPKRPVDERSLVVATAGLDQLFIRKEIENGEYQTRRETFIEKLRKRRETPRTREAILSLISDLNMSYAEKEISHEEYRRKRLELIELLREMDKELPKEIRTYSSILNLDQLFTEDKISVNEYIERRRKLAEELEAAKAVKARAEEETLVELTVKPTEKDLKTLMEILKLDRSFVAGNIGAEEYLEERQRLVGELETLKKIEERRRPKTPQLDLGLKERRMHEEGLEDYPIFELDRAFTEERIRVEEYLKRREGLVESIHQHRRSRYDIRRLTQLYRNHDVAAVQSYQHHLLNASENWLTRGVRVEYSGSYMVERSTQESLGLMKMIAGSVFMIRADLLREYGWSTSITEDWELTLRLYRDGYKVLYTPLNAVPAECPSTIKRLVQQRMRWSEGHTYNVRKYFRDIMTSPNIRIREKLEFLYYAPYYLQSFLFMLGTLCWLISEYLNKYHWGPLTGWFVVLYNLMAIPAMAVVGLFLEGTLRQDFTGIFSILSLTYILAPFQAYSSIKGLLEKKEGRWIRTFKTGKITERFALLELTIRRRLLSRFSRRWRRFLKWRMRRKKRAIGVMPTDERSVLTTIYELDRSFSENQITVEEFISERHKITENLTVMKRRRERRIEAKKPAKDRTAAAILELDNNFIEGRIGSEEYLRKRTSLVEKLQEEAA